MSQTRLGSLVEVVTYSGIGYAAALTTQILVFPLFGIHVPVSTNATLGLIFLTQSLILRYVMRRVFNRLHIFQRK